MGFRRRPTGPSPSPCGNSLRRNLGGMNRRAQQAVLAAMINHPALRHEFAEALGALMGVDTETIKQVTTQNAVRLFSKVTA